MTKPCNESIKYYFGFLLLTTWGLICNRSKMITELRNRNKVWYKVLKTVVLLLIILFFKISNTTKKHINGKIRKSVNFLFIGTHIIYNISIYKLYTYKTIWHKYYVQSRSIYVMSTTIYHVYTIYNGYLFAYTYISILFLYKSAIIKLQLLVFTQACATRLHVSGILVDCFWRV